MARIGITGHMNLTPPTVALIADALRKALMPFLPDGLTGISCIAAGTDSIFAETVLDLGGKLEVILPASDYRARKVHPDHADRFDSLIRRADKVHVMPFTISNRDAYEAANNALLASSDHLIAVWDGHAPADKGGTAAVIAAAKDRQLPVEIIWPAGAERA